MRTCKAPTWKRESSITPGLMARIYGMHTCHARGCGGRTCEAQTCKGRICKARTCGKKRTCEARTCEARIYGAAKLRDPPLPPARFEGADLRGARMDANVEVAGSHPQARASNRRGRCKKLIRQLENNLTQE